MVHSVGCSPTNFLLNLSYLYSTFDCNPTSFLSNLSSSCLLEIFVMHCVMKYYNYILGYERLFKNFNVVYKKEEDTFSNELYTNIMMPFFPKKKVPKPFTCFHQLLDREDIYINREAMIRN